MSIETDIKPNPMVESRSIRKTPKKAFTIASILSLLTASFPHPAYIAPFAICPI
jgi:hypothetical protein